MDIRHWPALLRAAGYTVVETPGWLSRSHGNLRDLNIVWHHDASPVGPSPGALNWMISNWDVSSAQIWVDRNGVWWFVGVGVAWHAGRVNDNNFDNFRSIGIETDHTTGEDWPKPQITSLRGGTALLLKAQGKTSANLSFHKNICVPVGRKSDPDGLDLGTERQNVQRIIVGGQPSTTNKIEVPSTPIVEDEEENMITVVVPTDIPQGQSAYPIAHDGTHIWGVNDVGAWVRAGAKQANVPYGDWQSIVNAYGGAVPVDIVGDNVGSR